MRMLVTFGSKRGGTEGIARTVAEALNGAGVVVTLLPMRQALRARGFDGVIVGGALYANRWHKDARRFVRARKDDLRRVPTWFFSSGPLDDSADRAIIPPTSQVRALMDSVGAVGHMTFGGRLAPDARGFPASAMAKKHAGDWRNPERVRAWAGEIARALPSARPGRVVAQPGGSVPRLLAHAAVGWAACAAMMLLLSNVARFSIAVTVHALVAPLVFAFVARHYFRAPGAQGALATAAAFVGTVVALDALVVGVLVLHSLEMFFNVPGTWLPLALIFAVTWAMGELRWMAPPRPHAPRGA